MRYRLYNVTDKLIRKPLKIMDLDARDFNSAFMKAKKELCNGLKSDLGLSSENIIRFTNLNTDLSTGFGENVRYTTCSIEDANGFVIDTYDYALEII